MFLLLDSFVDEVFKGTVQQKLREFTMGSNDPYNLTVWPFSFFILMGYHHKRSVKPVLVY